MRRCLIISALFCATFLASCDRPVEYIRVTPPVPAVLRAPVAIPARPIATAADLAAGYLEARAGLAQANGRIAAVDCILTAAESGADPVCGGVE